MTVPPHTNEIEKRQTIILGTVYIRYEHMIVINQAQVHTRMTGIGRN